MFVDVAGWPTDDEFGIYPEGSRDKYAIRCPVPAPIPDLLPEHRYLFKMSNQHFPVQFWGEIVAYRVGIRLGVEVPPAFPAINSRTDEEGALIQWFYGPAIDIDVPKSEVIPFFKGIFSHFWRQIFGPSPPTVHALVRYVPGDQYMLQMNPSFDLDKGTAHNFRDIEVLTRLLERGWGLVDGMEHWAKVLTFDAIIGNVDRHQSNWGVLWKGDRASDSAAKFAPAFDNGTALVYEYADERLARFETPEGVDRYVRRGTHHVRLNRGDQKRIGHFELLSELVRREGRLRNVIREMLDFSIEGLDEDLSELCLVELPTRFSERRKNLIIQMIERRRELILEAIA